MGGRLDYWRRIASVYLLGAPSAVTFWHEKPAVSEGVDMHSLGAYYMTFADKARYTGPRDEKGVIKLDYHGSIGVRYNPIAVAQYGLAHWNLFLKTKDHRHLTEATAQADWLVGNLEENEKGVPVWKHRFAWRYAQELKPGWYSGLAQGSGISLLSRIYTATKDEKYRAAAQRAFRAFVTNVKDGGVQVKDEEGNLWLEEYIVKPPTHILNGFLWTLWGVWDYWLLTGDKVAHDLFDRCIATLKTNLPRYDIGFWSLYDLSEQNLKMVASPFYHHLHVVQLGVTHILTSEEVFGLYAKRWSRYALNPLYFGLAVAYKAFFKIFYF